MVLPYPTYIICMSQLKSHSEDLNPPLSQQTKIDKEKHAHSNGKGDALNNASGNFLYYNYLDDDDKQRQDIVNHIVHNSTILDGLLSIVNDERLKRET